MPKNFFTLKLSAHNHNLSSQHSTNAIEPIRSLPASPKLYEKSFYNSMYLLSSDKARTYNTGDVTEDYKFRNAKKKDFSKSVPWLTPRTSILLNNLTAAEKNMVALRNKQVKSGLIDQKNSILTVYIDVGHPLNEEQCKFLSKSMLSGGRRKLRFNIDVSVGNTFSSKEYDRRYRRKYRSRKKLERIKRELEELRKELFGHPDAIRKFPSVDDAEKYGLKSALMGSFDRFITTEDEEGVEGIQTSEE
jgi:hypothetical protein